MANVLEQIIRDKKEILDSIKKNNSLSSLEKKIKDLNFFNNFKKAIQNNKNISLISEIKKASPSAGIIIENYNPVEIAQKYYKSNVTCLSVLTEEDFFLGKLDHISDIKKKLIFQYYVKTFLLILFKFI